MSVRSIVAAALIGAAAITTPAAAATLGGPTETSALTTTAGGVRFRALATSAAQEEVYLGKTDLGVGGNRVAQNVTWNQNGANRFSFGYDAGTDTLTSSINGGATLSYANFLAGLAPGVAALPFNMLQIQVRDDAVGAGAIALSNLSLNGVNLTPASLTGVEGALRYWQIDGDFRQSFTLVGDIDLSGTFGASAEANRIELTIGNAVPEPATWAMMIGGFGLVGAALRRRATPRLAAA
jgi:hypothetical protein